MYGEDVRREEGFEEDVGQKFKRLERLYELLRKDVHDLKHPQKPYICPPFPVPRMGWKFVLCFFGEDENERRFALLMTFLAWLFAGIMFTVFWLAGII